MSDAGKNSTGGSEFAEFRKDLETTRGIRFFSRVEDVPPKVAGVKRLAIISARECIVSRSGCHNEHVNPSSDLAASYALRYIRQSWPLHQLP
jgi:hypothetical protein